MKKIEKVTHFRIAFRQCGHDEAKKIKLVEHIRDVALEYLPPAVIAKVPPPYFSDEVRTAYAAKGISLEWNLTILGDTGIYAFFFSARDADLTPSQLSATALLFACTEAIEANALSDRVQQKILDAYAGLDLDAVKTGETFLKNSGRKKGALSQKTKYINQLVSMYPELCSKELYRIADKSILGEGKPMQISTFDKKVSEARNSK